MDGLRRVPSPAWRRPARRVAAVRGRPTRRPRNDGASPPRTARGRHVRGTADGRRRSGSRDCGVWTRGSTREVCAPRARRETTRPGRGLRGRRRPRPPLPHAAHRIPVRGVTRPSGGSHPPSSKCKTPPRGSSRPRARRSLLDERGRRLDGSGFAPSVVVRRERGHRTRTPSPEVAVQRRGAHPARLRAPPPVHVVSIPERRLLLRPEVRLSTEGSSVLVAALAVVAIPPGYVPGTLSDEAVHRRRGTIRTGGGRGTTPTRRRRSRSSRR